MPQTEHRAHRAPGTRRETTVSVPCRVARGKWPMRLHRCMFAEPNQTTPLGSTAKSKDEPLTGITVAANVGVTEPARTGHHPDECRRQKKTGHQQRLELTEASRGHPIGGVGNLSARNLDIPRSSLIADPSATSGAGGYPATSRADNGWRAPRRGVWPWPGPGSSRSPRSSPPTSPPWWPRRSAVTAHSTSKSTYERISRATPRMLDRPMPSRECNKGASRRRPSVAVETKDLFVDRRWTSSDQFAGDRGLVVALSDRQHHHRDVRPRREAKRP